MIREFDSQEVWDFSERDLSQHIYEENHKTRFEYDVNSENSLIRIRAIQGYTEGNTIPLELMDHVAIPYTWKEFVLHRCYSFNIKFFLTIGSIQEEEKVTKKGKQSSSYLSQVCRKFQKKKVQWRSFITKKSTLLQKLKVLTRYCVLGKIIMSTK